MKLTEFGRFIRKYRIDNSIFLKDMADKLGVTSAFLSAIETGNKPIPLGIEESILENFEMTPAEQKELLNAVDASRSQASIKISQDPLEQRLVGAFCRKLNSLDDEQRKKILKILTGE